MGITRVYGTDSLRFNNALVGIGIASTALLHISAGSADHPPIRLTTGTAAAPLQDGALEYDTSHLWFTIGGSRFQLDQQTSGHTQNTDTGTTQPTFVLNSTANAGNDVTANMFSASVVTPDSNWRTIVSLPLSNNSTCTFTCIITGNYYIAPGFNIGAGFEAKGVAKRVADAASTVIIDSFTFTVLGADVDPFFGNTFVIRALANTTSGTIDIDVRAQWAGNTTWGVIGYRCLCVS